MIKKNRNGFENSKKRSGKKKGNGKKKNGRIKKGRVKVSSKIIIRRVKSRYTKGEMGERTKKKKNGRP